MVNSDSQNVALVDDDCNLCGYCGDLMGYNFIYQIFHGDI